ncbi:MAG: cobalt-precorrin-5B (C(1))-methyltransferase CbiD [Cyanobacteriota bacterium]|nr:cobalt-precorrin-5B (C(1))-methyltransferase CbiD [Cyanobacteriota bacterium]
MAAPPPATVGLTLPVWAAAAARAALQLLRGEAFEPQQPLDLLAGGPPRPVPVCAAAPLGPHLALGRSRCDPGPGLDLTRDLEVWALVALEPADTGDRLLIEAGEGVGVHAASGEACLSEFARRLLAANLLPLCPADRRLRLRVVLPRGAELALRTSNAAFGVVDGLALIGTRADVQAGADPHQLDHQLAELKSRAAAPGFGGDLVLVIGDNGLDLAPRCGLPPHLLLKAGNWLGPLLVAAAAVGVRRLLLFGYHGKLIKLAGGIFHTHHHLADGRAEVLTALAALEGLAGPALEHLHGAATVEAGLAELEATDPALTARLQARIAATVEQRSLAYLASHGQPAAGQPPIRVGAALFDRARRLRLVGPEGQHLLEAFRGSP